MKFEQLRKGDRFKFADDEEGDIPHTMVSDTAFKEDDSDFIYDEIDLTTDFMREFGSFVGEDVILLD